MGRCLCALAEEALTQDDSATRAAVTAGQEEALQLDEKILIVPGNPPPSAMATPSFFPTAEGFYDCDNLKYIYQYRDHLGNVRISYSYDSSEGKIKIEDTNDYYPFGLSFLSSSKSGKFSPSTTYKNYKYNGKELQETGMYDYGWRSYMPDIGRWISPDPLTEEYQNWTPYRYSFNNPVNVTDPNGLLEDWYKDRDGSYVYDAQLNDQNASSRLSSDQQYLGPSGSVILMNNGNNVGNMQLARDGNVTVTGPWADAGNVSYSSFYTPMGFVQVVDPKLVGGARVFGVGTFYNKNSEEFSKNSFEYNARFVAESSPKTLSKYLGGKIEKIEKDYEITQRSFEEGTGDDMGVNTDYSAIVNSALKNKEVSKYGVPQRKLDNMQNDSVWKRSLIYPNQKSSPKPTSVPIPKNKL